MTIDYFTPSGTAVKMGERIGEIWASGTNDAFIKFNDGGVELVPYCRLAPAPTQRAIDRWADDGGFCPPNDYTC